MEICSCWCFTGHERKIVSRMEKLTGMTLLFFEVWHFEQRDEVQRDTPEQGHDNYHQNCRVNLTL